MNNWRRTVDGVRIGFTAFAIGLSLVAWLVKESREVRASESSSPPIK